MNFKQKELKILLALRSNPFLSHKRLSEELDLSWVTVRKYYNKLVSDGIIQKKVVVYNPWKLGLVRMNVLAFVNNYTNLQLLEKACDEHPYTHYRSRFIAGDFGLYIKFDVPKESLELLTTFLDSLVSHDVITHYEFTVNKGLHFEAKPDISKYDTENNRWQFNWSDWFKRLSNYPSESLNKKTEPIKFSKIKPSHLKILRQLTKNADFKQTDLKIELGLTRSEISRQVQFVKDKLIQSARLLFNLEAFDLSETYLIRSGPTNKEIQGKFAHAFKNDPPPFNSSLEILEDGSIEIWANVPSLLAQEMVYSCWPILENSKTFILSTRGNASMTYWFYDENFDFGKRYWKTSKKYIVTEPLSRIFDQ